MGMVTASLRNKCHLEIDQTPPSHVLQPVWEKKHHHAAIKKLCAPFRVVNKIFSLQANFFEHEQTPVVKLSHL